MSTLSVGEIIERFTNEIEETEKRVMHSGSGTAPFGHVMDFPDPEGLIFQEDWSTAYRGVWTSWTRHVIVTYVEGDVSVEYFPDPKNYADAIYSAAKFYEEH